jgi:hypothetical protein
MNKLDENIRKIWEAVLYIFGVLTGLIISVII